MVRAHVATLRGAPAGAAPRPPSVRQVTGWLTRHPTTLTEDERAGLKEVLARCPDLDKAAGHVRDFGEILTDPPRLHTPHLDRRSRRQPTTRPHRLRTPPTPRPRRGDSGAHPRLGAVNRIKKIKRQLYGRAGFELLRKMILLQ